jgi:P27 family predicted phage terminase small subunit
MANNDPARERNSRMAGTGRPSGRPAKPLEIKRALGQAGLPESPLPGEGLEGSSSVPIPPALNEAGLALWFHVWTAGRTWLAVESDQTIITLLCQAQDEAEEIRLQIQSGEIERFYTTANGQMVTHPMVTQLATLRTQMTAWLAAIGFSPADRSRLGLAEVRVRDELDELQRRRVERTGTA